MRYSLYKKKKTHTEKYHFYPNHIFSETTIHRVLLTAFTDKINEKLHKAQIDIIPEYDIYYFL